VHTLAAPQPALHGRRFGPLGCHGSSPADAAKFQSLHSGFATAGLTPGVPSTWTILRAAGDPPVVPGTNNALFNGGGSYDIAHDWITLGDYGADSATEYDASSGVHNPKYIVAGLAKAQELAKSVNGSFANVRGTELVKRGATAVVAGKVVSRRQVGRRQRQARPDEGQQEHRHGQRRRQRRLRLLLPGDVDRHLHSRLAAPATRSRSRRAAR